MKLIDCHFRIAFIIIWALFKKLEVDGEIRRGITGMRNECRHLTATITESITNRSNDTPESAAPAMHWNRERERESAVVIDSSAFQVVFCSRIVRNYDT